MFSQHRGNGFGSDLVYSNSLDSSAEYQDCYSPEQWLELSRLILSYSFRRQYVPAALPKFSPFKTDGERGNHTKRKLLKGSDTYASIRKGRMVTCTKSSLKSF